MSEKKGVAEVSPVAPAEEGSKQNPIEIGPPDPIYRAKITYHGPGGPRYVRAAGIDARDGVFMFAKPVAFCQQAQDGRWYSGYRNEVFLFVPAVEIMDVEILVEE